jgi:hypothetical protein
MSGFKHFTPLHPLFSGVVGKTVLKLQQNLFGAHFTCFCQHLVIRGNGPDSSKIWKIHPSLCGPLWASLSVPGSRGVSVPPRPPASPVTLPAASQDGEGGGHDPPASPDILRRGSGYLASRGSYQMVSR